MVGVCVRRLHDLGVSWVSICVGRDLLGLELDAALGRGCPGRVSGLGVVGCGVLWKITGRGESFVFGTRHPH